MPRSEVGNRFSWGNTITAILLLAGLLSDAVSSSFARSGNDVAAIGPLIARGYLEAPDGTVMVGGDPGGGAKVLELRIEEGQYVKKGDVLAVLSELPGAESRLRQYEAQLAKAKLQRHAILSGFRIAQIRLQEIAIKSAVEQAKLKAFEHTRSAKPSDVKELESSLSQHSVERQQIKLRILEGKQETDTALNTAEIETLMTFIESARLDCEAALVRAPISGTVVQIFARAGEYVDPRGMFKIVDMSQLRILADVDDLHRGRIVLGGKAEIVLRGSKTVYVGTIVRLAAMVKRVQKGEIYTSSSPNSRLVEVEIKFDDLTSVPKLFGHEARVTFL